MRTVASSLALAAVLALPGCQQTTGKGGPTSNGQAAVPDLDVNVADPTVLVYGRSVDSITLDPAAASDGESAKVIDNVFETLFDLSEDPASPAKITNGLAVDSRHSADRMNWTFTLREGVRFHDGEPVDAEAVKFSIERLIDPEHPYAPERVPYRSTFANIHSVEVQGPHKLQIHLHVPSVLLRVNLAMFSTSIVSPKAVKAAGKDFGTRPVGSGPFRFESWTPGAITLRKNDKWWVGSPGGIDRLVFLTVESWAERREMLKAGRVHAIDNIDAGDESWLASTPGIKVARASGMSVCYLALNNDVPPIKDNPALRKAIAQCIDRELILREGYAGSGAVAHDLLPANIAGGSKRILPEFNVAEARAAVAASNWADRGPIKLWHMKSQRPYLMNPQRVALIIRDALRGIGLEVEVEAFDWSTYRRKLKAGEHQLALMGWTTDNGDPDNFYTPLLSEAAIGATNYVRLHDADFEKLLAASRNEADRDSRVALFSDMQEVLSKQCPIVPLVHTNVAVAMRDDVSGLAPHPIKLRLYQVRRGGK